MDKTLKKANPKPLFHLTTITALSIVTTPIGFLHFWGIVFIVATTLVLIFKREDGTNNNTVSKLEDNKGDSEQGKQLQQAEPEVSLGLFETYNTLWRIMRLRPIYIYVLSLMLIKLGFSATDSLTGLKLIEKGVSKEKMAFIGSLIVPVQILLALAVSKHTTGDKPLNIFIKATFPRLLFGPLFCLLVYTTPMFQQGDGSYSYQYYVLLTAIYSSHQIFVYPMFVSLMAFYARISDPAVGGTYMTLLNTVTNLASNIPSTIMLYLVDHITVKQCVGGPNDGKSCSSKSAGLNCTQSTPAGACVTTMDGYYLEVMICTVIGVFAMLSRRRFLTRLQSMPLDSWRIFKR